VQGEPKKSKGGVSESSKEILHEMSARGKRMYPSTVKREIGTLREENNGLSENEHVTWGRKTDLRVDRRIEWNIVTSSP